MHILKPYDMIKQTDKLEFVKLAEEEINEMEIWRITQTSDPLYEKALHLYSISFPSHEQRESLSQEQVLQQDAYHFDVICDSGEFIGEILYWDIGGAFYIEHFCVLSAMRNKHYGQKILNAYQPTPLILEIDPPVDELSIRRKGFYERCGFVANPYYHIHPAYHRGHAGHELVIMSSPEMLKPDEYERFNHYLQDTVMKNVY